MFQLTPFRSSFTYCHLLIWVLIYILHIIEKTVDIFTTTQKVVYKFKVSGYFGWVRGGGSILEDPERGPEY